jgi:hypothetical protein
VLIVFALQDLTDFMWIHSDYVNPEWVLDKDHVSLMGSNSTHVWFCVTDPKTNVYNLAQFPFVIDAQWNKVKQLVIMPHQVLHRYLNLVYF